MIVAARRGSGDNPDWISMAPFGDVLAKALGYRCAQEFWSSQANSKGRAKIRRRLRALRRKLEAKGDGP